MNLTRGNSAFQVLAFAVALLTLSNGAPQKRQKRTVGLGLAGIGAGVLLKKLLTGDGSIPKVSSLSQCFENTCHRDFEPDFTPPFSR